MQSHLVQIGPYRVEEQIGSGGMAAVYRGVRHGAEGFERRVAIKVLLPELAQDDEFVEMFQAEARLASRLEHPTLVPVTDLGVADGTHFMVMELLEGLPLAEVTALFRARDQQFPRAHALWVVERLLEGLHYAHELRTETGEPCNVVHRDLSPRNVFVTRSGAIRLVDFGIARSSGRKKQTQIGVVKGTVPYMAPEQARGQALDRRADIFGAGVLLHVLLTGKAPIVDGETEIQRRALASEDVEVDLKGVHLSLRPVLQKALAARPDDRFATAEEMGAALAEAREKLEPHYLPEKLGALVSQAVRRREQKEARKSAQARKREQRRRQRAAENVVVTAAKTGATHTPSAVGGRPLPPMPVWDSAQLLAVVATMISLMGAILTFGTTGF